MCNYELTMDNYPEAFCFGKNYISALTTKDFYIFLIV